MVSIGIIGGAGYMGGNHARICSKINGWVGVFDKNQEKAKEVAENCNGNYFVSLDDLLKEVTAVIIATPNDSHYDIANRALSKGKHVLVEKPICTKTKDAENLCKSAKEHNLVLATGHIERYNPAVNQVKSDLDENKYGTLLALSAIRVSPQLPRVKNMGVIRDLAIHDIDIGRYLTKSEVESIYCVAQKRNNGKYENMANLTLEFNNGITQNIIVNCTTKESRKRSLNIICDRKTVEVDYAQRIVNINSAKQLSDYYYKDSKLFWVPQTQTYGSPPIEPLEYEVRDFINAINKNSRPLVTGEDGLAAVVIANSAIKSYQSGKTIYLDSKK